MEMSVDKLIAFTSLLLCVATWSTAVSAYPAPPVPRPLIFDHGGAIDDYTTLILLLSQPERVKLLGVSILPADCIGETAVNTTIKLLNLLGHQDVPVAVSTLPAHNPFPDHFRSQGLTIDVMPLLNQLDKAQLEAAWNRQYIKEPAQEFVAQMLLSQTTPLTVLATGPLSNIAYALKHYPATAAAMQHMWWMGGALEAPGNVRQQPNSDGSAEWNAYYDPPALETVWSSGVPLTIVPLDVTNKVPVTPELLWSFGEQSSQFPYSNLAGMLWAPVVNWFAQAPAQHSYYAWDTLTAAIMLSELPNAAAAVPTAVAGEQHAKLYTIRNDVNVTATFTGLQQGALEYASIQPAIAGAAAVSSASAPAVDLYGRKYMHHDPGLVHHQDSAMNSTCMQSCQVGNNITGFQGLTEPHVKNVASKLKGRDSSDARSGTAVRTVSVVVDVDAEQFKRYIYIC